MVRAQFYNADQKVKLKRLKYLHYFLVEMGLDLSIMLATLLFVFKSPAFPFHAFFLMSGSWLLANILSYPTGNRRYISYIHTIYRIVQPYVFFCLIYALYLQINFPDWKIDWSFAKYFAFILFCLVAGKVFYVFALRIYRKSGNGFSNYGIVSSAKNHNELKGYFGSRAEGGFLFHRSFSWEDRDLIETKRFGQWLSEFRIDELYVDPQSGFVSELRSIIEACNSLGVIVYLFPVDSLRYIRFYNFRTLNDSSDEEIFRGPSIRKVNAFRKRVFDLLFASLVSIFLLSWLLPILAILIKIDSPGPVFFHQKRSGKNGKPFTCLKLRTMIHHGRELPQQATKNDIRVTGIGAFLRSTSLDELPQFFNVLLGQMSVVGPRPHPLFLDERFAGQIPDYTKRFWGKPGITGLSQTFGYRGLTEGVDQMKLRIKADVV